MIRRLRSILTLLKASKLASQRDILGSLSKLKSLFLLYGSESPTPQTPVIANLLFADMSLRAGNESDALSACRMADSQIRTKLLSASKNIQINDLKYLHFQCRWILLSFNGPLKGEAKNYADLISIKFSEIDTTIIHHAIYDLFPIDIVSGEILDRI